MSREIDWIRRKAVLYSKGFATVTAELAAQLGIPAGEYDYESYRFYGGLPWRMAAALRGRDDLPLRKTGFIVEKMTIGVPTAMSDDENFCEYYRQIYTPKVGAVAAAPRQAIHTN